MPTQLLTMLAYQLPELLAASLVLALLRIRTRTGAPGRRLAVAGALVVLLASLLRLLASLGQGWVLARGMAGGGESLGTWLALYSAAVMLFALASAVGLALLGWGALRAISAAGARAA
ncbi:MULTISPECIES: hypothetical protein [Pseudoxanthomonas]|jgi:hypothetical protein|uniref:Uncharacterized protein n=1 Tax=Pseudoxanthomonas taiwanensis J19 TaxID=935569 RepID=A0A562E223_9GAMM|nr:MULTISPECIES: hypothetical protein [Pseudoxanthomonas]TWH16055.1 hypothetical protein L613_001400000420 [Pseudoxanthomonas taiwanensis J19]